MNKTPLVAVLAAALALSACSNEAGKLAFASGEFAQCSLAQGTDCKLQAPPGTVPEKASVAAENDALRVNATLTDTGQCQAYAHNAVGRWPGYIAQAVVNHTVVVGYGDTKPNAVAVKAACDMPPPYHAYLIVAKAPG